MASDTTRAVPIALPFDDEGDAPVPFALTAAAHRALDPSDVPALRVVREGSDTPDAALTTGAPEGSIVPDDLRPAQARALRRSGMRVATIAAAMSVEAALVTAWTADVDPGRGAVPTARPRRAPGGRRGEARTVRGHEASAAAGLAVALSRVDLDGTVLTLTDDRPDVLAAALGAIRGEVRIPSGAVRVAARAGTAIATDRLRARLVEGLGVPAARVIVGRWPDAPDPAALEVRVRVSGRRAVEAVDAWATALADPIGARARGA